MKTLKKTPLFAAFILLCGAGISQNNVTTLRFTASTQGHYTQLDSVATHSITEQWSETIVYPDTVLALENAQVGLTQATDVELGISSYPNPFGGKTHIGISVAKPGKAMIGIYDMSGRLILSDTRDLLEGNNIFELSLDKKATHILSVSTADQTRTIKLLNQADGGCNNIVAKGVAKREMSEKGFSANLFHVGDSLVFVGYATYGNSLLVSYPQRVRVDSDMSITLIFAPVISMPLVETDSVTSVTDTSAILHGTITSLGNDTSVSAGFVYSTDSLPTLADSVLTISADSAGSFSFNVMNLTEDTRYYARAYITNSAGTTYGRQLTFAPILQGALQGLFSIDSAGRKIRFSQGNLQWSAQGTHATIDSTATGTWRFATNQYDYCGGSTTQTFIQFGNVPNGCNDSISPTFTGWIDLFGWGTSGWDNGNQFYQPYESSNANVGPGYGYGPYDGNTAVLPICDTFRNADWGVFNAISNGGNTPDKWRLLTSGEWNYLMTLRQASTVSSVANARFAKVVLADTSDAVNGILLFPDLFSWPASAGTPITTAMINNASANWSTVDTVSIQNFNELEAAGCVFLPFTTTRNGLTIANLRYTGRWGSYWTSSPGSSATYAAKWYFNNTKCELSTSGNKFWGEAVRLVRDIAQPSQN